MRGLRERLRRQLVQHLRQRAGLYFLAALCFAAGVGLGALAAGGLDDTQRLELAAYVSYFLQGLRDPATQPDPREVFRQALTTNLRTGLLMAVLGLTAVGAPLCLAVLLVRGFVSGFAVAFLVGHRGWGGLLMAALGVLPQNLVAVPALVVLAVAALTFAAGVAGRRRPAASPWRGLASYLLTAAGALLALAGASAVEGYAGPLWLRLVAGLSP